MVVIIDYGLGNLRSVQKAFARINVNSIISDKLIEIEKADKLVLPGVGFFAFGMQKLKEKGLIELLHDKVLIRKTPILGICLGMQLMTRYSEEGDCEGLGWISAETRKIVLSHEYSKLKIPHMGWNNIKLIKSNEIIEKYQDGEQFYFVHSYAVKCSDTSDVVSQTTYGITFDSAFQKDNIVGVQFHPEKSHKVGLDLLKNFSKF